VFVDAGCCATRIVVPKTAMSASNNILDRIGLPLSLNILIEYALIHETFLDSTGSLAPWSVGVSPDHFLRYKHRSPITTKTADALWLMR
jgi:hypothetical protein